MIVIKHEMSIKKREDKCAIILCLPVEELENKEDKKWKKKNGKKVLRKFNHIFLLYYRGLFVPNT